MSDQIYSTLFATGNLWFEQNDFMQAELYYNRARDVWLENGQTPTNEFVASCNYKLGCLALEQHNYSIARYVTEKSQLLESNFCSNYLVAAQTITALRKVHMPGDYARATHKLSQALRKFPDTQLEADLKRNEAENLLRSLQKTYNIHGGGDKAYDDLICILWR